MKRTELTELKKAIEVITKLSDISKVTREQHYVVARALFYEVAMRIFEYSSIKAAGFLGRDHATALHALKNVDSFYTRQNHLRYNDLKLKLEVYYTNILGKELQGGDIISLDKSLRVIAELRQEKAINELRIENFKKELGKFSLFLELPEHKQTDFIETRLKPYLKMHT